METTGMKSINNRGKPRVFVTTDKGCTVCTSHAHNHDGYLRLKLEGKMQLYHRYVWEKLFGKIPENYEVNHKCKNRACSNIEHLECIEGREHASLSNRERYADVNTQAKFLWMYYGATVETLSKTFGRTQSCVYRWLRKWKLDLQQQKGNKIWR